MDNAPKQMNSSASGQNGGYVFNPYRGFYSVDPREEERKALVAASGKLGSSLLAYYGLSALIAYASGAVLSLLTSLQQVIFPGISLPFDMISDLLAVITRMLCLFFPFFFFLWRGENRQQILLKKTQFKVTAVAVIMALGVAVIGSAAADVMANTFSLFHVQLIYPSYTVGVTPAALAMSLVQVVIVPAVLEEIVFRGIVMQSLRHLGDAFALVASSFAFAILHGNPLQIPYAFLMGLAIGYFVLSTGSLWTGIIAHLVNNLVTVLLSILSVIMGKNYPAVGNAVFLVILIAALGCFIASEKRDHHVFILPREEGQLSLGDKLMALFSKWQVVGSAAVALFLMMAQYVKVG